MLMEEGYAWSAAVWINDHILELGLTAFYSLCILTIFAVINKRFLLKKRQEDKEKPTELPQESNGRKLCRIESSVDHLHKYGGSIGAYVLLLNSKVYLNPNMVKNALVYLTNRHEILRIKISRKKTKIQGNKKIIKEFKAMENSDFAEFLLKLKATTSDQWLSVFERELMKQFPEEGPLWRFVMLKEQFHPKEGVYSNAFVFSAHHLVCDFESGFNFFSDFLDYLNSSIQDSSLSKPDFDVKFPLQLSFSHLLGNCMSMSQPLIAVTAAKVFVMKMIEKIRPKPTYKNPFTSTFHPTITKNPTIQKKTCLIPRSLTKEETLNLIKLCKANKCTVYGAVSAATTIAMATILRKGKSTAPLIITSSFQVDLRKDCNPKVEPQELGHYSMNCSVNVPLAKDITLPLGVNDASFWLLAQECDRIFHTAITNNDHLNSMKLMTNLNINPLRNLGELAKDQEAAGRQASLFHLSNLGKKSIVNSDAINLEGFYFALAEHNIGPVFSNNIASVNGVLYWGFTYFTNVTTESQAVEYADLVMNCIKGNSVKH
ncbi:uncharacterized protein LOC116296037 [Actinia tenebrosa]|uniref:Uncharacterized protein LOC116296037 n=1 Tax=Actinia tenebrosa TaxID=6105 RepID=A0A6P8I520_ACTTE|nr:uncharacterized protein LOC116296037 [Actinia tenebrosa]